MSLRLSEIRIKNYRSIENVSLKLNDLNVLIGQNNCGKSNLLRAICIAINSNYSVTAQDIYIKNNEQLTKTKTAIIDIKIQPFADNGNREKYFSEFWIGVFGDKWIVSDETEGDYVGIRTTIEYDAQFDQYITVKHPIKQWGDTIDGTSVNSKRSYSLEMQSYMMCYYMDAQRDIIEDIKNKRSYFGRAISNQDMPETIVSEIESKLTEVNDLIVRNTPALKDTQTMMSHIGDVVGVPNSELNIEPISRKVNDLHRGIDVKFKDGNGASFSVSEHGMGTRSWMSFLTLDAFIKNLSLSLKAQDDGVELFVVLALEEPEAHLHSFAQKKLFSQIKNFLGQKIISTHSANIVAQADIDDLIHLYKDQGITSVHRIKRDDYDIDEIAKIRREVIRSNGELLFSTAIILAEGITEEQALPVFFNEYFSNEPNSLGVAIIGIDGQNYKTYLRLVKDFNLPWFIFSDGEDNAKASVGKALLSVYGVSEMTDHVIILDNGDDFEKHLAHNGYGDIMVDAINEYERRLYEEENPAAAEHDMIPFFDKYIRRHSQNSYEGEAGRINAIIDCCQRKDGKAKYSYVIAKKIVDQSDPEKRIPPKIKELMELINAKFGWRNSL